MSTTATVTAATTAITGPDDVAAVGTARHRVEETPGARWRRRIGSVAAVTALVATAGVAWAAWTSSGEGSASATATTAVNSTISGSGTTGLYPGADRTLTISINNPNPYPVKVTGISAGSSAPVNGCAAGSVTTDAVTTPAGTTIAPGASGTYTLTARMISDAGTACQGQTFTLPLTATLASTS